MPSSVTQKAKSGNVLALLDTFYSSGFATVTTPSNPMLKGRTLHTLYAFSFLVYSTNCFCDWVHVYCTLRGFVTTFPLKTWLVIVLVTAVVCGSMLTALLLVLCVENAFIHRMNLAPYSSGWFIIIEAFIEWIQAFNNFRVAFLIMLLHDAPMTFINFFLLSACRCAGSEIWPWSLLMSSLSTIVSVLWRLTMLYFAYRRMVCPPKDRRSQIGTTQQESFLERIETSCSISDGGRLTEFDETWPFRFAKSRIYQKRRDLEDLGKDKYKAYLKTDLCPSKCRFPEISRNACGICCGFIRVKGTEWIVAAVKSVAFGFLVTFGYLFYVVTLGLPFCYHYTCRKGSFYSRHRCSKSCVRFYGIFFHYTLLAFSVLGVGLLLAGNVILISSVQIIGFNHIPPELNHVCIEVDRPVNIIKSHLKPSNTDPNLICKPIWENNGVGWALQRSSAGPWQTRIPISRQEMIIVSTQLAFNYSDPNFPAQTLFYDFAVLSGIKKGKEFRCRSGDSTEWRYDPKIYIEELSWPYFSACVDSLHSERKQMFNCDRIELQHRRRMQQELGLL
ncbi:hypothetical protein L596_029700 [Steinernema carpocapsae]|uniref:Uncharacterized protein n=1 Tax=Steinernema carpocapsae TaxID=34508 RepID=A0A4U5LQJ9_STECR|nr:hypothetical protein L596_029700 [Steinernema carpocapsae]